MTILQKIGVGVATAAVFASVATSAFASTSIKIKNNGKNSTNKVTTTTSSTTVVEQSNETTVFNGVLSISKTGGNKAKNNTDGDVSITSGNATSKVTITNDGSTNTIGDLPTCGCDTGDTNVTITGNGKGSSNSVTVTSVTTTSVEQVNETGFTNYVGSVAETGGNSASGNTGGTVDVTSGNSSSTVNITNGGSSNTL